MMAKTNDELLNDFKSFIPFVKSLADLNDDIWENSLEVGKWTLKDVISHIMLWDKYFYEEAIQKIVLNEPLTVKHLNFDDFNKNAIHYAKNKTKKDLIDELFLYRSKIIDAIAGMSEEEFMKEHFDGDRKKFSVRKYLKGFIPHDSHHKKQIQKYIKSIKE